MREKTIYEKIAEKYNTTPEEVRREMQIAIRVQELVSRLIFISSKAYSLK